MKRALRKAKTTRIIFALLTVGALYSLFFIFTQRTIELKEPLLLNATRTCTEKLESNLLEDLQKIQSYQFPSSKPFLPQLLPHDFNFIKSGDFTQQNGLDQSLPSLPALVTAFSANHFTEATDLIENINTVVRSAYKDIKFYIIDLGLSISQKKELIRTCKCEVIEFPFHKFPDHVRNLQKYCWKPLAIQMVMKVHRFVVWMDASVRFQTKDLDQTFEHARTLGVQAAVGYGPIAARTSNETFNFLQESPCVFRNINEFEATFIMIYANDFIMQHFMIPWVSCALTEQCMAPVDLIDCYNDQVYFDCHRFDQSMLSILMARLFHSDLKAHAMQHTFFKICKNGFEIPLVPEIFNKYLNQLKPNCF